MTSAAVAIFLPVFVGVCLQSVAIANDSPSREVSSCGQDSVPFSVSVDLDGRPELFCDVAACFEHSTTDQTSTSLARNVANKREELTSSMEEEFKRHRNRRTARGNYAHCNGQFANTVCDAPNEWTGSIAEINNGTHISLHMECCINEHFSDHSRFLKSIVLKPGERYVGGPVHKENDVVAFDIVKEIRKNVTLQNEVRYVINIHRMICFQNADSLNEATTNSVRRPTPMRRRQLRQQASRFQKFRMPPQQVKLLQDILTKAKGDRRRYPAAKTNYALADSPLGRGMLYAPNYRRAGKTKLRLPQQSTLLEDYDLVEMGPQIVIYQRPYIRHGQPPRHRVGGEDAANNNNLWPVFLTRQNKHLLAGATTASQQVPIKINTNELDDYDLSEDPDTVATGDQQQTYAQAPAPAPVSVPSLLLNSRNTAQSGGGVKSLGAASYPTAVRNYISQPPLIAPSGGCSDAGYGGGGYGGGGGGYGGGGGDAGGVNLRLECGPSQGPQLPPPPQYPSAGRIVEASLELPVQVQPAIEAPQVVQTYQIPQVSQYQYPTQYGAQYGVAEQYYPVATEYIAAPVGGVGGGGGGGGGGFFCFSGDLSVQTPEGPKLMSELRVGDLIIYSPVIMFIHKKHNDRTEYRRVETADGEWIKMTDLHLIWASDCVRTDGLQLTYAKDLQPGQCVHVVKQVDGRAVLVAEQVAKIEKVQETGFYAPLTANGNIVVNNVLASCHSNMAIQTLQQTFFAWYKRIKSAIHNFSSFLDQNPKHLAADIDDFQENSIMEENNGDLPFGVHYLVTIVDYFVPKGIFL